MIVGACCIEMHLPEARSLKDKRQVVKSLTAKIAHRFNVSVSEVGYHDLKQRAVIAVAHVGRSRGDVEKVLNRISAFARNTSGEAIVRCTNSYFNPEKDF